MKKLLIFVALLLCLSACSKTNANGYDNSMLSTPDPEMNRVENTESTCKVDVGTAPIGVTASKPATSLPTKPVDPAELERRRQMVANYRTAAQMVADKSHNQHAQDLLKFLDLNGRVGIPIAEGMQTGEDQKPGKFNFLVIPLRHEDVGVSELTKKFLNLAVPAAATYNPTNNGIVLLDSVDFSETWKGIIFLHELEHACAFNTQPYPWQDPWVYSLKERVTHQFQNELINALGGPVYADWKQAKVKQIKDGTTTGGGSLRLPNRGEYDPKLDQAFGPAASELDRDARATHTWLDAVSVYYAERFGENANYQFTLLLRSFYAKGGTLPPG